MTWSWINSPVRWIQGQPINVRHVWRGLKQKRLFVRTLSAWQYCLKIKCSSVSQSLRSSCQSSSFHHTLPNEVIFVFPDMCCIGMLKQTDHFRPKRKSVVQLASTASSNPTRCLRFCTVFQQFYYRQKECHRAHCHLDITSFGKENSVNKLLRCTASWLITEWLNGESYSLLAY